MLLGKARIEQIVHCQLEPDIVIEFVHVGETSGVGQFGLHVVCPVVDEVSSEAYFF